MTPVALATLPTRPMNKNERRYSEYLDELMRVGEIRWWDFECLKFRLADNTYYTPDFLVVAQDLRLECHEVKAFWKNAGHAGWKEDSRAKVKIAAESFPIKFRAVWLEPDGNWHYEEFNDHDEPANLV